MSIATIDGSGRPLAFPVPATELEELVSGMEKGAHRCLVRALSGMQKEALVAASSLHCWRIVCDEHGIQPSVFYGWQRQVMESLASALETGAGNRQRHGQKEKLASKIGAREAKLAKKDNVIAEISEEFVRLRKTFGEP